jgi:hypothetical protein
MTVFINMWPYMLTSVPPLSGPIAGTAAVGVGRDTNVNVGDKSRFGPRYGEPGKRTVTGTVTMPPSQVIPRATFAHGGGIHATSVDDIYTAGTLPNLRFPNWHVSELEFEKCIPDTTILVLPIAGPDAGTTSLT